MKSIVLAFLSIFAVLGAQAKPLVYCSEANPEILNPTQSSSATAVEIGRIVFSNLVKIERGSTRIIADAAKSWTVSKDGKTYTFKLKPGIQFHSTKNFQPTRAMNAEDLVFSFDRMLNKEHPFHSLGRGVYPRLYSMGLEKTITGYRAVDPLTFEIQLNEPMSPFLAQLAHPAFGIVLSKEYADQLMKQKKADQFDLQPVGSGPYQIAKYRADAQIRFKAHKNYFGEKAKSDDLIFVITKEASVRKFKLLQGECHIAYQPAPSDIQEIEKSPKAGILRTVGLNVGYLGFNFEKPPLDNILVRQAVYHALNRENYINSIYLGNANVAHGPLAPDLWGHQKSPQTSYEYNPTKAKELLKKAGYADGLKLELWTLPVARLYNPNGKKMGELMQADLKAVGIDVKLVTYEWGTFLAKGDQGEHQMIQVGWNQASGDPDSTLYPNLSCDAAESGANWARWCDQKFDGFLRKAREVTDQKKREKLYHQAQDVFSQEIPWVPLAHGHVYHGVSKEAKNVIVNPDGSINFSQISL